MADNYLERRQEQLQSASRTVVRRSPSLDSLLLKSRSHRAFDNSDPVAMLQLQAIVSVNTKIPSCRNAQTLRFKLIDAKSGGDGFCSLLHLGGYLPQLNLPVPGTEPRAFIVVCSTTSENATVDIDLGISLQSMALKAAEIGLNTLIVRAFDREEVRARLSLPLEPLAVLAVGKGADNIRLTTVAAGSDLRYYREGGVHFVPKIDIADMLL